MTDKSPQEIVASHDLRAASPAVWADIERLRAENTALRSKLASLQETGPASAVPATFQARVDEWLLACFGETIARDKEERNHRFLEEALELVQACGCTQSEAHQLVDYVFGREVGQRMQETGGVMVTLAALCSAHGLDMAGCGEVELSRVWAKVEAIRAKQAAKPKHSPLPASEARSVGVSELDAANACIQRAAMSLGSTDEWTDQASMIADFEQRLAAMKGDIHAEL